jgi:hypothetical protein
MTQPFWKSRKLWSRVLGVLGVLLLLALATHPELRLLVPFLDAIGLDALLLLLSAQALSIFSGTLKPGLLGIWGHAVPLLSAADRLASSDNLIGAIRVNCGRVLGQYSGCLGQYAWACAGRLWRLACLDPGNSSRPTPLHGAA